MSTETTAQMLSRIIHKGGKILVVGGGVHDLPDKFQQHPALLLWDDNSQGCLQKNVPSNVRAILWNRWVSHAMANKLNQAVQRFNIVKFPMLKTREIKELLSEIVQEAPMIHERTEAEMEQTPPPHVEPAPVPAKPKGDIKSFIAKHVRLDVDWTERGSIIEESRRLFELATKEGLQTTQASLATGIGTLLKEMGVKTSRTVAAAAVKTEPAKEAVVSQSTTTVKTDDFKELEGLIDDAVAALKLVQEHLPKVRVETERLRKLQSRILSVLTDEG